MQGRRPCNRHCAARKSLLPLRSSLSSSSTLLAIAVFFVQEPSSAYDIGAELGRGGMGAVYSAHHKATGRACVLKRSSMVGTPQFVGFARSLQVLMPAAGQESASCLILPRACGAWCAPGGAMEVWEEQAMAPGVDLQTSASQVGHCSHLERPMCAQLPDWLAAATRCACLAWPLGPGCGACRMRKMRPYLHALRPGRLAGACWPS